MNSTETKKLTQALKYWMLGMSETNPTWHDALIALEISKKYHCGTRKDGKPEFSHQINIASFIRSIHKLISDPISVIITALLHDTYEDYEESKHEIAEKLPQYYDYIYRISKIRNGEKISYQDYFTDIANCPITSIVKAVDRIHNISTMGGVVKNSAINYRASTGKHNRSLTSGLIMFQAFEGHTVFT